MWLISYAFKNGSTDPDQTWCRQASGHGELHRLYMAIACVTGARSARMLYCGLCGGIHASVYISVQRVGGCPMRAHRVGTKNARLKTRAFLYE